MAGRKREAGAYGRSSLLTPKRAAKAIKLLRGGATEEAARRAIGISADTWADWKRSYPRWLQRIERAQGTIQAEVEIGLATMATQPDRQGRRDSKAAIQWLTNRDNAQWKERRHDELSIVTKEAEEIAERGKTQTDEVRAALRRTGKELVLGIPPGETAH